LLSFIASNIFRFFASSNPSC